MTAINDTIEARIDTADADGWLTAQLPRPLAEDPFIPRFLASFEHIAASVQRRIEGIEYYLDPTIAPPEFVRWIGGWVGLAVDASLPLERQRRVVDTAGALLGWRGTRLGLQHLLEALTGGTAEVADGGGVVPAGQAEPTERHVTIRLEDTGGVDEGQLLHLVRRELPVEATVTLIVAGRTVEEPTVPDRENLGDEPPPDAEPT